MSTIKKEISNAEVIPQVESGLFSDTDRMQSRFAVGLVAVNGEALPGMGSLLDGVYMLRKNVYVDQTGQLDADVEYPDGQEIDKDDKRSASFFVAENLGSGVVSVVSTGRMIIKNNTQDVLPIEQEWPEVFDDSPATVKSFEVSRVISRHGDNRIAGLNTGAIYSAITGYANHHELGPPYAIVEDWFCRALKRSGVQSGVPHRVIGDPKMVEKYLDVNLPIVIDLAEISRRLNAKNPKMLNDLTSTGGVHFYGKTAPSKHKKSA